MTTQTASTSEDVDELVLYATNTSELYPERLRIIDTIKINRAALMSRDAMIAHATKRYRPWFDWARIRYRAEIGRSTGFHFTAAVLTAAAREQATFDVDAVVAGEYDERTR